MAFPRVAEYYSREMQRLGFLKFVAAGAAANHTTTLEWLGSELVKSVTHKVRVVPQPCHVAYIKRRLTDRAYRDLREQVQKRASSGDTSGPLALELQDLYLASAEVPSRTGKLTSTKWDKYPQWATGLGLIMKGSYSIMVRGMILMRLVGEEELQSFKDYSPDANPMLLGGEQRLFFLYCLLEHDGDLVLALYRELLEGGSNTFSDRQAGDRLPNILARFETEYRAKVRSGDERKRLSDVRELAATIAKSRGKPYRGMSAREEFVTVRLEPMTDIGLLAKEDPFAYSYALADAGRRFFGVFCEADGVEQFLMESFFGTWCNAFSTRSEHERDEATILRGLIGAWEELKSAMGYAPIVDTALLAGIRHLTGANAYFEVGECVSLLKRVQKQAPHWLYFNIDRMGNLRYLKFQGEPPPHVTVSATAG